MATVAVPALYAASAWQGWSHVWHVRPCQKEGDAGEAENLLPGTVVKFRPIPIDAPL